MSAAALTWGMFASVDKHEPAAPAEAPVAGAAAPVAGAAVVPARPADLSDEELMQRYQQGDGAAFQALFARHGGRLYGFFAHRTGSRAQAEDLTQRTWLRVHHARQRFRLDGRFLPWLYTIAANLGRSSARDGARERLTADGSLPAADALVEPGLSEEHRAVRQALAALPEGQREVILLHRFQGLGFAEIAAALGTSEGAVKLRAHRAYKTLRALLTSDGAGGSATREDEP